MPPSVANATNPIPSGVIFASNITKPNTVMGTLFRDPTMAYVVAEVTCRHQSDAKLR